MNDDEQDGNPPSPSDVLRRWRYTLGPTLYIDENSDVSELLWQQVLEQRAIRAWLVVIALLLLLAPLVTVVLVSILT